MGFHNFAGSAVIHFVGGLTALIGAKILGPRVGKFNKDGSPNGIPGHSLTIGALGVFILWFGWYGFNGAASKNGTQLATIFATTTVAPALATCTVMIFTWLLDYKLHIDDPVGAVAVHFGNGLLGTICVGLFACGTDTMPKAQGLFYGGGFKLLGTQLLGLLCIGVWTAVLMTITFVVVKHTVGLRVTEEEITGLDKLEHGLESAYAGFALKTETYTGATTTTVSAPELSVTEAVPTVAVNGEGKIFIYNVENVVRISSGEQSPEALSYED